MKTAKVRALIRALIHNGPFFSGSSFNCNYCGQTFMGTAQELARIKHRPGCAYQQAVRFLLKPEQIDLLAYRSKEETA